MSERDIHCPFLNRADTRCSPQFSLNHLPAALSQCLGAYQSCPVYLELLLERRVRRQMAATGASEAKLFLREAADAVHPPALPLVQVSVHHRQPAL